MKAGTVGDQAEGGDLQGTEGLGEGPLDLLGAPGDGEGVEQAGEPQEKSQGCEETKFPLESIRSASRPYCEAFLINKRVLVT